MHFWRYDVGGVEYPLTYPRPGCEPSKLEYWPDFSPRQSPDYPGSLYIIDEIHLFFGARDWQKVGSEAQYFISQHGKLRCDILAISQNPEKVDKNFRRDAQDFTVVRNLGNERQYLGVSFKGVFRRATFLDLPRGTETPMETGTFRLNTATYGKLYATSAGVGLAGRVDTQEVHRGRSPWVLVALVVLILCGAFFIPKAIGGLMNFSLRSAFGLAGKGADFVKTSAGVTNTPAVASPPPVVSNSSSPVVSIQRRESSSARTLEASGFVRIPGCEAVCLRDGRMFQVSDGYQITFSGLKATIAGVGVAELSPAPRYVSGSPVIDKALAVSGRSSPRWSGPVPSYTPRLLTSPPVQ